jgi:hypothetical protein
MKRRGQNIVFRWLFLIAIWVTMFTGFGNMPLYRRYYVTDLPGMGWAGNFFANVYVHYISGAVVLTLSVYFFLSYFSLRGKGVRLTSMGVARTAILALGLVSGVFMALKNLPEFQFSFNMAMILNFLHLGMAMLFLLMALVCFIGRRKWVRVTRIFQA